MNIHVSLNWCTWDTNQLAYIFMMINGRRCPGAYLASIYKMWPQKNILGNSLKFKTSATTILTWLWFVSHQLCQTTFQSCYNHLTIKSEEHWEILEMLISSLMDSSSPPCWMYNTFQGGHIKWQGIRQSVVCSANCTALLPTDIIWVG